MTDMNARMRHGRRPPMTIHATPDQDDAHAAWERRLRGQPEPPRTAQEILARWRAAGRVADGETDEQLLAEIGQALAAGRQPAPPPPRSPPPVEALKSGALPADPPRPMSVSAAIDRAMRQTARDSGVGVDLVDLADGIRRGHGAP